jgi:hypothetical protein
MPVTATDLIGQRVSFDHDGKRLAGIVTAAQSAEPWGRGKIPDFRVTVRGTSGRELTVSMVETYMSFPDR